jgi:hypothetical protein
MALSSFCTNLPDDRNRYLLRVRIFLDVMVDVPAQRDKQLVDEIVPGFLLLIRRSKVKPAVLAEISHKFLYCQERLFKDGLGHGQR